MRTLLMVTALSFLAVLFACNSQENRRSASIPDPLTGSNVPKAPTPGSVNQTQNPSDTARRITAEELHKLWEKNEVLIVDTRNEPSFKQGHIRGSILIPANEFQARADELPKNKMIVTYCT